MATLKFDELNALWFNKMELPTAEKLLRIEMAAVFERELNKIFSSQRERADSDKYLLYATVYATIMSSTYIEITNNYFLKYVLNIASNVKGLSEYSQKWIVKHSEQFAKEIQQTTQRLIESGDYDNAFSISRARTISRTEINVQHLKDIIKAVTQRRCGYRLRTTRSEIHTKSQTDKSGACLNHLTLATAS